MAINSTSNKEFPVKIIGGTTKKPCATLINDKQGYHFSWVGDEIISLDLDGLVRVNFARDTIYYLTRSSKSRPGSGRKSF